MPVRDRRYENLLRLIFGALIALALLYEAGAHVVTWCEAIIHHFAASK